MLSLLLALLPATVIHTCTKDKSFHYERLFPDPFTSMLGPLLAFFREVHYIWKICHTKEMTLCNLSVCFPF